MNLREKNVNTTTDLTNYVLRVLSYSNPEVHDSVRYAFVKEGFRDLESSDIFNAEVNPETQVVSATFYPPYSEYECHISFDLKKGTIDASKSNRYTGARCSANHVALITNQYSEELSSSKYNIEGIFNLFHEGKLIEVSEVSRGFNKVGVENRRRGSFAYDASDGERRKCQYFIERPKLDKAYRVYTVYDIFNRVIDRGENYYILNEEHGLTEMNFNGAERTKEEYDAHICTDVGTILSYDHESRQAALRETFGLGFDK